MTKEQKFAPPLTVVLEEEKDHCHHWAILHQCLLMLFDSPLNHAGLLEVYISLADGRLIRMHREGCEMPVVQTKDGQARLLQFANKSLERQLRDLANEKEYKKFKIVNLAPKLRSPDFFAESLTTHDKIALFIEFGPVDFNCLGQGRETEYEVKTINKYPHQETYSISRYPLSPSLACAKLATSFEKALDVF